MFYLEITYTFVHIHTYVCISVFLYVYSHVTITLAKSQIVLQSALNNSNTWKANKKEYETVENYFDTSVDRVVRCRRCRHCCNCLFVRSRVCALQTIPRAVAISIARSMLKGFILQGTTLVSTQLRVHMAMRTDNRIKIVACLLSKSPPHWWMSFFFNGVIEMQLRRHCMLCLSASSAVWNRRDSDCWHPFVFLASHSVSVNERWDKLLFARRSSSVSLANTLVVYIASKLHVLASSCWQTNSSNNKNTNWEL